MEKTGRAKAYLEIGTGRDRIQEVIEDIGVTLLVAWLCFDSWIGLIAGIPIAYLNHRRHEEDQRNRFNQAFRQEYRELLNDLAAALSGGTSIEGAFRGAEKEIKTLFGNKAILLEELHKLNSNVSLSMPVEAAFTGFAEAFPYEEVQDFAELFRFSKRLGGNYGANIRRTAVSMGEAIELRQEIEAITAEKRMELKIMCAMPLGILAYIRIASPDFVASLYGNLAGTLVMIGALILYAGCMILGRRILRNGTGVS